MRLAISWSITSVWRCRHSNVFAAKNRRTCEKTTTSLADRCTSPGSLSRLTPCCICRPMADWQWSLAVQAPIQLIQPRRCTVRPRPSLPIALVFQSPCREGDAIYCRSFQTSTSFGFPESHVRDIQPPLRHAAIRSRSAR